MDALEGAYRAYQEASGDAGGEGLYSDRFAALVYHVPYGKMSRKAHRHVRTLDGDKDVDASFERLVGPSLMLPSQVGNIYTGSMYLALASLLSCSREDLTGKRVGLFSYAEDVPGEGFRYQGTRDHKRIYAR